MAGAGEHFPWVFHFPSGRPLKRLSRFGGLNIQDVFWLDEIREHGLPIAHHFRKHLIYILYKDIIFSMDDFFLLKLFEFNLPEPLLAGRFERVGGVLQRSWILGIIISSGVFVPSPLLLWVEWCGFNSRDSPIATISQLSWLINQIPPNPPS